MSILDRITRALRSPMPARLPMEQRQIGIYNYATWQFGKPIWPRQNLATYYGYYDQVVIAFACINLIADAAAAAKVRVYDESKDDAELPDHPMRQLLARPNAYMSEAEFYNTMVKLAAVSGFAVAEKQRATAGRVIGLHPLRSDWLKAIPRQNNMTDWEYKLPSGETYSLLGEDVVAWTYQGDALMGATGTTPLSAANRELSIETAMVNFTKAFFDGGGIPMTGLVLDEDTVLEHAEAETLKEKFQQARADPWSPIILQTVRDVKRLGFDLNEMAYKDLRHLTSTQISTAFRVPPVMLGTLAGLENSPWSKYEEARRSFYEDTITPLWARLDGALTRSLLPEFEVNPRISLEFDTSEIPAFQEDDTAEWTKANIGVMGGWLPVNSALQMVGHEPIPGQDVFLRSIATIEVPALEQNGQRSNAHHDIEWRELQPEAIPSGLMRRLPAEVRANVAATNKQQIVTIGERGAVWLRKFWREQAERVLKQIGLRSHDGGFMLVGDPQWRAANNPFWDEEARQLLTVLQQVHTLAGRSAFKQASALLGVEVGWDVANPNIQRVLSELATRVVGINDTTRTDVQRIIGDSLQEGARLTDIADNLRGLFVETYKGRSETVGRTESMTAYNKASTLSYQESGVVASVEFVDNPAHDEDYGASDGLTCATRDGLIVALDRVDAHIAAEHPNGSLAIIPVLSTALGEE